MSKIWYCRKCGYEVRSRGRCHSCKEKLTASALPALVSGSEDDEVGYRLDTWSDRGRLIEKLNHRGILHRFEDDELVVDAGDEDRVDDLVSEMTATGPTVFEDETETEYDQDPADDRSDEDEVTVTTAAAFSIDETSPSFFGNTNPAPALAGLDDSVRLLAAAAARLETDPTDMQADGDVAEASAGIFLAEGHPMADDDTWAAVGRVTRRLLAVLGAEEALESEIKNDAAVLARLLRPLIGQAANTGGLDPAAGVKEQTVYEMAEWLPEQRAQLGVLLDERSILHEWDGDDLLVPADREDDVEELFAQIGGVGDAEDDDTGEDRYHAVAELFAACGRLAGDPSDEGRADAVLQWVHESQGPPLLGMDEVAWFHIMTRAKSLVAAVEENDDLDLIRDEANALHDLLRAVV